MLYRFSFDNNLNLVISQMLMLNEEMVQLYKFNFSPALAAFLYEIVMNSLRRIQLFNLLISLMSDDIMEQFMILQMGKVEAVKNEKSGDTIPLK